MRRSASILAGLVGVGLEQWPRSSYYQAPKDPLPPALEAKLEAARVRAGNEAIEKAKAKRLRKQRL